jgi:L-alanine-DL-glutamate epimerase-like enolase superfamily enzyme
VILRANLVSSTAIFADYRYRAGGWFGDSFCTIVEVQTSDGVTGVGTAGAFCGAAKHIVEDYLADLVLGFDVRERPGLRVCTPRNSPRVPPGEPRPSRAHHPTPRPLYTLCPAQARVCL